MCGADPDPGCGRNEIEGVAVGCRIGGSVRPRPSPFTCSPASMSTPAPIAPAPSTSKSTPRSLTAAGSWLPRAWRTSRITNKVAITTSRTTPTPAASWYSGPPQRRAPTAPRSPASPTTISSTTGSSRTSQSCAVSPAPARLPSARSPPSGFSLPSPGASACPAIPGGIAPGWRLVIASRSWCNGRPSPRQTLPAARFPGGGKDRGYLHPP